MLHLVHPPILFFLPCPLQSLPFHPAPGLGSSVERSTSFFYYSFCQHEFFSLHIMFSCPEQFRLSFFPSTLPLFVPDADTFLSVPASAFLFRDPSPHCVRFSLFTAPSFHFFFSSFNFLPPRFETPPSLPLEHYLPFLVHSFP